MTLVTNFFIGFIMAFVSVLPPGLLNIYVAKVSRKEGRKKALVFSSGVIVTVFFQTYIALLFARYLNKNPELIDLLQKVALGIFVSLTVYFLFIAKDTRRELRQEAQHSKTSRFFSGMFLAALNVLPLPYWVYISITFSSFGWFTFNKPYLFPAALASAMGTFAVLIIYAWFFRAKENQKPFRFNMNKILGIITAIIAVVTFLKILQNMP